MVLNRISFILRLQDCLIRKKCLRASFLCLYGTISSLGIAQAKQCQLLKPNVCWLKKYLLPTVKCFQQIKYCVNSSHTCLNRLNGCNTFEGQSNCLSLFSHIHLKFVKRGQGSQLYNLCVPTFVELSLK